MKSFSESLQITKNMNLAKQCFHLMAEKGIDPVAFVDWYCDYGVIHQEYGVLLEHSVKWTEDWKSALSGATSTVGNWLNKTGSQLAGGAANMAGAGANMAGKAVANGTQFAKQTAGNVKDQFNYGMGAPNWYRQADTAAQALDQLHRRIGVSPELRNSIGGEAFMQTVLQLMQTIRGKDWSQMQNAALTAPAQSESFVNHLKLKNEIRSSLRTFQSHGYDPVKFVEWFGKNIKNLNEGLFDSAGEWLGNQWANATGTANRWLTGDQKQNWGYDAKNRATQKNTESITASMKALDDLQKSIGTNINPTFKQTIDQVVAGLQKASAEKPADETHPEETPAPSGLSTADTMQQMQQNQQPVKSNVVGEEMENVSNGDFSSFGDNADEMRQECEKIKNLSNEDPKKHERFAYLMRYFDHPRQNEIRNIRGNVLSEAMFLAGITIR